MILLRELLIIGAGGHARSVLDIALTVGEYNIIGCLDSVYPDRKCVEGFPEIPIVGGDERMEDIFRRGARYVFIAIGDNRLRKELYDKAVSIGFTAANLISPVATISPRARLGRGICAMPGVIINACTSIGNNVILNTKCSADHDCKIGDHCHIAPGATLSGCVSAGEGAWIGTGASVIEKVHIGRWSYIGAGAAVVRDVEEHVLSAGVPAKYIKNI